MLTLRIPKIPSAPNPTQEPEPTPAPAPALRPSLSTPKFSRNLTTLSLSWLHGRFEAVAIHKGELSGTWSAPESTEDLSRLPNLIQQAIAHTGYHGTTTTLLLAHPKLTQQLVESPPAKGAALTALVQRQIERLKGFEGPAAWSFQPILPSQKTHGVIAYILPRSFLDDLVDAARQANLHLVSVLPATPALVQQLQRLPIPAEDLTLLVAETGSDLTLVVGRNNGSLALVRSLDSSRSAAPEALAVDLNRTVLFVAQQFGASVASIWLHGPALVQLQPGLQNQLSIPVRVSPEEQRPCPWAHEAAQIPAGQGPILVSLEQRKAPQRQVLFRAACLIAVLLTLLATLTVAFAEILVRRERREQASLQQRTQQLQQQHQEWQRTVTEFTRRHQLARAILDHRPAPLPVWFLAYLSDAVPPSLTLTRYHLLRTEDRWQLHLAGRPGLEPSSAPDPAAFSTSLSLFIQNLESGPFAVRQSPPTTLPVSQSSSHPAQIPTSDAVQAVAHWTSRLTTPNPSPSPPPTASTLTSLSPSTAPNSFVIDGFLP